jgi:hypothetical protein
MGQLMAEKNPFDQLFAPGVYVDEPTDREQRAEIEARVQRAFSGNSDGEVIIDLNAAYRKYGNQVFRANAPFRAELIKRLARSPKLLRK